MLPARGVTEVTALGRGGLPGRELRARWAGQRRHLCVCIPGPPGLSGVLGLCACVQVARAVARPGALRQAVYFMPQVASGMSLVEAE